MPALIRVTGLRELSSTLRRLGGPVLAKHVRNANLEVATFMAQRMSAAAPRGSSLTRDRHPGKLAASVKPRATQRSARVSIGKGLDYTKPIIFGWPKHHIAPHRFPYDVLDEARAEAVEHYQAAVEAAIAEVRSGTS